METIKLVRIWSRPSSLDEVQVGSEVFASNFTTRKDLTENNYRSYIVRVIDTKNFTVTVQPNKMDAEYVTITKDELTDEYGFFKKL